MKKQTTYPKFIPRIFSSAVDMFILAIVSSPIMRLVQQQFVLWKFKPYLISHGINTNSSEEMFAAFNSPEFQPYFTFANFLTYAGVVLAVQGLIMGLYFVYFWVQKGWTPGKYITGMRLVDDKTLGRITLAQGIKRFFALALFPISIWFIFFTEKHQSLHDKLADTLIIKN